MTQRGVRLHSPAPVDTLCSSLSNDDCHLQFMHSFSQIHLKLRPKTTKQGKTNTNLPIFLGLGRGRSNTNWFNPILKRKWINAFSFFFFLKAQVVAGGDSHMYIHQIIIDPERALLEREEHFPRQSLVSPLVGNYHAIWKKEVYSFHRRCATNYQPIPTWIGLEPWSDPLCVPTSQATALSATNFDLMKLILLYA